MPPSRLMRRKAIPASRQSLEREFMMSSFIDTGHYAPAESKLLCRSITSRFHGAKDGRELVRGHHLQLLEGAVTRALVVAPPPKLRCVAKSTALHVIVPNFDD